MKFSISKQSNDYSFFLSDGGSLIMTGTAETRKQALKTIFDVIKNLLRTT